MAQNTLSTREVATMLNVTETTIKRWADDAIIPCVRTPGGHRKFRLRDLARFAESNGYTLDGSKPPAMTGEQIERLQIGVHTRNYAMISDVFREEALQADREGMLTLFLYLYKQQFPLMVIVDEVVRPAFSAIGTMWEEGKLEVNQEHAASQVTTEALVRTVVELHRKDQNNKSALCACPEGEFHELGLRGLAYSLECEGWKVRYLGANTPADTIVSFIRTNRPELVCLSVTTAKHRGNLTDELKKIASAVHSNSGKLIVGGHSASKFDEKEIRCDRIASSIQDAISYSRDVFQLKPGPRKKTKQP